MIELNGERRAFPGERGHEGRVVRLVPQEAGRDAGELFKISHGDAGVEGMWRFMPVGPFSGVGEYGDFLERWNRLPDVRAFTVRRRSDDGAVGSVSLMNVRPEHGVAELGNIWFSPSAQRTGVNREANFLLLRYCFEELGYRRMEWKCHSMNEPSRRAAEGLGFTFEGVFRQHMILKGENRDTAWFSLLDGEWPGVRAELEGKFARWAEQS